MKSLIRKIKEKTSTEYQKSFDDIYTWKDITNNTLIILLILFVLDYLNVFTIVIAHMELIPIYFIGILLIIIKIIGLKLLDLYKLKTVNYIDAIFLSSICALCVYSNYAFIMEKGMVLKGIVGSIFVILIAIMQGVRIKKINNIKTKDVEENVYDLKELYDGAIKNRGGIILFKEKEVSYDLLERSYTINKLYELIKNCNSEESFVIALEGEWGSGKTTIINNLKKKVNEKDESLIIIDDFNPWYYEDEKALLNGMFDTIMAKIGHNFSVREISKFINFCMDTIFNKSKYESIYINIKKYYGNNGSKLKKMINAYLSKNNIKMLFIIDNIERANKENIIFLFKIINNILDFNNTVYLLSFDDKRMEKIFEKDLSIDYEYLKKIIQMEVKIPQIHESVMSNIIRKCLNNLFELYGFDIQEENKELFNILAKKIKNLRELKRFINSAISFYYDSKEYLNVRDVILLEVIKINNLELYEEIWRNKKYFISHDTHLKEETYILNLDMKKFNNEAKEYFDKLFSNKRNEEYESVLSLLFPYVENYKNGKEVKSNYYYIGKRMVDYKTSIKEARIFNARYFDLYFSQCNNEFIEIRQNVEKFIKLINGSENFSKIDKGFKKLMCLYQNWIQKYTFETLEAYLKEISTNKKLVLLKIINIHLKDYNNDSLFMELNSLQRIYIVMAELIIQITGAEFQEFEQIMKNDFSRIGAIRHLEYWIEHSREYPRDEYKDRLKRLEEINDNLIKCVIKNNINILHKENYMEGNIWGIYNEEKENLYKIDIKKYVKNILNSENIFRFLNDMVSRGVGKKYGFTIPESSINIFSSIQEVDNILATINRELTEDEQLLLQIYEGSKKIAEDESALYFDNDKRFIV